MARAKGQQDGAVSKEKHALLRCFSGSGLFQRESDPTKIVSVKKTVVKMCVAALLLAVVYLLTSFAGIPYPGGAGYLNFSDAVILFSASVLGPWWGALVGAAGGALADLTAGYAFFVPFTILAKGGEAVLAGYLSKVMKKPRVRWLSFLVGASFMVLAYVPAYAILEPAFMVNSAYDLIQAGVGAGLAVALDALWIRRKPEPFLSWSNPRERKPSEKADEDKKDKG